MSNTTSVSRFKSWGTTVTDALAVFATVWGAALGVLMVGVPLALVVGGDLRLGRMVFSGL